MFRAQCAHHQEVKIVLYSVWYRHTCRWPSRAQVERGLECLKHVEAYNKSYYKTRICALNWIITKTMRIYLHYITLPQIVIAFYILQDSKLGLT